MSDLSWLDQSSIDFPPTERALDDPNGLLAVGGDLSPERLIQAYRKGIFPWYNEGQPILWWSPSPRMVLYPDQMHTGRTLRKLAKKKLFTVTVDQAFREVIDRCATVSRNGELGTWITEEMADAYAHMHEIGIAHSVEAWHGNKLVGGLYGIGLGKVFFGESMFSEVSGASKIAFATLVLQLKKWDFKLIDCQVHTEYLESFGATEIDRKEFESQLAKYTPSILTLQQASPCADFNWPANWSMPEFGFE